MAVHCWQDSITLRTYLQGPPSPHACFDHSIYPYTMQDDLLDEAEDRDYVALHLESEFLHVIILPQLGGKVYSVWDKLAGREVFYRNSVVKPLLMALRGAWVCGGIEFNFFHYGHSQTTMSPVSFEMGQNGEEMGSGAWITVSNIDLSTRARWAVTLSVKPGDPRLYQRVWLRNRAPHRQRCYFWADAGLRGCDDLQLVYPHSRARMARAGVVDYPLWDGRDLSLYRNHPVHDHMFMLDSGEDFFGCYYPTEDVGLVHLADSAQSVGKKFFTWGTGDEPTVWEGLLSDGDGEHLEMQSGRFIDQTTYEFMHPFHTMQWEEVWWPLHGIGGWTWASDEAVIDFRLDGARAQVAAVTCMPHDSTRISIRAGETVVWSEITALAPDLPFKAVAELGDVALSADKLTVSLESAGRELLRYMHPPVHSQRPSVLETGERDPVDLVPEGEATAVDLHLRGVEQELKSNLANARRLYLLSLQRDPAFASAHCGLGVVEYRMGRFEEAREHFTRAVDLDGHDCQAKYYLALATLAAGDRGEALAMLRRLIASGMSSEEVSELLLWAGGTTVAQLSPAAVLDRPEILRDEPEQWLEVAAEYVATGSLERALGLLREGCSRVAAIDAHALVHYTLAHYLELAGDDQSAKCERQSARECDPAGCFAWRLEDISILRAAMSHDGTDWVAQYLLGNLMASLERRDEALEIWEAAAGIDDSFTPLLRNIGWAHWRWRNDLDRAQVWYRRAIEREPNEYRLYAELDAIMTRAECPAEERFGMLRSAPEELQVRRAMKVHLASVLGAWWRSDARTEGEQAEE
jgi:tetratricopeptide (TPR) repeat protein